MISKPMKFSHVYMSMKLSLFYLQFSVFCCCYYGCDLTLPQYRRLNITMVDNQILQWLDNGCNG